MQLNKNDQKKIQKKGILQRLTLCAASIYERITPNSAV